MKLEKKPQLKALTGIRFFAAMHVVLFHYLLEAPLETFSQNLANFIRYGYSGVSLFFVLSGFILAYNYADREVSQPENLKKFWVARFARIYPLYLVGLILSLPGFINRIINASSLSSFTELSASFVLTPFLLQAWTPWTACTWNCPGWSLGAEAFFYALFPFIAIYIYNLSNKKTLFLLSISWLISMVTPLIYLNWFELYDSSNLLLHFITYCPIFHLPQFIIGVTTGVLLLKNIHGNTHFFTQGKIFEGFFQTRFDFSLLILIIILVLFSGIPNIPYALINNGLLAPLFALGIYILSIRRTGLARFLASPYLIILGEASYGMYLLHLPINSLVKVFGEKIGYDRLASSDFLIFRVIFLIGLSISFFFLIEKLARKIIVRRF
jgi:peptidoglycan/LPS O-acetylase OafA/YrhL